MQEFETIFVVFLISTLRVGAQLSFPEEFIFGAASSAYQVEGAWNVSGKGQNIWDNYTHTYPERIVDGSNGDVATDSYHLYQKDINALKEVGAKMYRFSLSWSRLLPTGYIDNKNEDGVRFYNELIDALLCNGIEPMVTLYHWDTPQTLQEDFEGFANPAIIPIYVDYADYVFGLFGDRVKYWVTFNEVNINCVAGYGRTYFAPGLNRSGVADYLCAHHILLAHAHTYQLYRRKYACKQNGKLSIAQQLIGYYPLTDCPRDIEAADIADDFVGGWLLHPILSETGDYPPSMKRIVLANSLAEGLTVSRLPEFTPSEIELIKGSVDYLGINHYVSLIFTFDPILDTDLVTPVDLSVFILSDMPCFVYFLNSWPFGDVDLYRIAPEGYFNLLVRIKEKYGDIEIIITENGYPSLVGGPNPVNDFPRVDYLNQYLVALLQAREQGVNIIGHLQWSITDNFEWANGYVLQFGLFGVDYASPTKERSGRLSSRVYKHIVSTRIIDEDYLPLIEGDATIFRDELKSDFNTTYYPFL